jgi:hypothetical protein
MSDLKQIDKRLDNIEKLLTPDPIPEVKIPRIEELVETHGKIKAFEIITVSVDKLVEMFAGAPAKIQQEMADTGLRKYGVFDEGGNPTELGAEFVKYTEEQVFGEKTGIDLYISTLALIKQATAMFANEPEEGIKFVFKILMRVKLVVIENDGTCDSKVVISEDGEGFLEWIDERYPEAAGGSDAIRNVFDFVLKTTQAALDELNAVRKAAPEGATNKEILANLMGKREQSTNLTD